MHIKVKVCMFFFFIFFFPLVEKLKFDFPKERAKTRLLKFIVKPMVLSVHAFGVVSFWKCAVAP